MQGFQQPIVNDSFIVDGVGALGNMHSERGLTYVEVALAGHMYARHRFFWDGCAYHPPDVHRVPQFSPAVSWTAGITRYTVL